MLNVYKHMQTLFICVKMLHVRPRFVPYDM